MAVAINSLRQWPKERSLNDIFVENFTVKEKESWTRAGRSAIGMPEPDTTPDMELRESLANISKELDGNPKSSLFLFQDRADLSAVTRRIAVAIRSVRQQADDSPLFEVEYIHGKRGDPSGWIEAEATCHMLRKQRTRVGSIVCQIIAKANEQQLLLKELEKNAKTGTYKLRDPSMPGLTSSYLVEIKCPKEKVDANPELRCCVCRKSASKTCGACKSAQYCSKECQVRHWKTYGHKQVCTNAKEARNRPYDTTSPSVVFWAKAPDDCIRHHPMAKDRNRHISISNTDGSMRAVPEQSRIPSNIHGDDEFIVKVQALNDCGRGFVSVYDKERSFWRIICDAEPVYRVLEETGRRNPQPGLFSGMKTYLKAKREADNFRVTIDSFPPQQQGW